MLVETQYFPCIAFWANAIQSEGITIESFENYQKRSYRNKCNILSVNKSLTLSIPLERGKNSGMPIREVKISDDVHWKNHHKQSIRSAYGNAPYFEFYWDDIEDLINKKEFFLYDFNLSILQFFSKMYGISISESKNYNREYNGLDLRQKIIPKTTYEDWPPYDQVFSDRHPFSPNLSILDLLFCTGPESKMYLRKVAEKL